MTADPAVTGAKQYWRMMDPEVYGPVIARMSDLAIGGSTTGWRSLDPKSYESLRGALNAFGLVDYSQPMVAVSTLAQRDDQVVLHAKSNYLTREGTLTYMVQRDDRSTE